MAKEDTLPWFLCVTAAVIAIDRLTKILTVAYLQGKPPIKLAPFFHLTYVTNTGVSFGMLTDFPWIPFIVGILVVCLISWNYRRIPSSVLPQHAMALILGGAIGNIWDRMVYGTVIDFLDFRVWPVFNIADSAITIGAVLMAYWALKHGKEADEMFSWKKQEHHEKLPALHSANKTK